MCQARGEITKHLVNGKKKRVPCDICDHGYVWLWSCPKELVDAMMNDAINLAAMCDGGTLPSAGGLLDQSAWMLHLIQTLRSEEAEIRHDQWERDHGQ